MPALIEAFAVQRGLAVRRDAGGYRLQGGTEALTVTLEVEPGGLAWGAADPDDPRAPQRLLARDALVPVVSPRRDLAALSLEDLSRAFAGEATDWAELGAGAAPLALHLPDGPMARAFEEAALRPFGRALAATVTRHPDGRSLARAVASDPDALGVTVLAEVGVARAVAIAGACGVRSMPGAAAARSGEWPLTLRIAAILPAHPMPRLAADLAAFATSPEAQPVIRRAGLLDEAPRALPLDAQGERLASAILAASDADRLSALREAVADLRGLTRLTTTFRFEAGLLLDPASEVAAERLARRIASGEHDGRHLVFVGFGDGTGAAEATRALSVERARAVMEAVRGRTPPRPGGPVLSAAGHGAALPVACDDTAEGRSLNRRVELWTR
jgi:phosphate transport system substrate-binding protein